MLSRLRLVLRALRWRRSSSLAVLLAAVAAFAAACLGPLWAAATQDTLATRALAAAPPAERALALGAPANVSRTGTVLIPALALREAQQGLVLPPPLEPEFDPPRLTLTSTRRAQVVGVDDVLGLGPLLWRDGGCASLRLVQGRCPTAAGEVALSDRSAAHLGVAAGDAVRLPELAAERPSPGSGTPFRVEYVVSGVYLPPDTSTSFWAGSEAFRFRPPRPVAGEVLPARLDAVLGSRTLLESLSTTELTAQATRVLLDRPRTGPQVEALGEDLTAWAEGVRTRTSAVTLESPAVDAVNAVGPPVRAARTASLTLGAQVLLLACWVLALVVTSSSEGRTAEAALGNLRGLRRRSLAATGLAEPLLLLLLAVPLGVAAGALVTGGLVDAVLPGDVALRADPALRVVLGAALLATVLAVLAGVRRLLSRSVLDDGGDGGATSTGGPVRLAAEAAVVTVALVALGQLVGRGSGGDGAGDGGEGGATAGLGLLAPSLAAVAAGLLLSRGLVLLVRPWTARTRRRGSLAGFLAVRRLAHRGAAVRTVVLVAVAVASSAYAGGVLALGAQQREAQAVMEVGARAAYVVQPMTVDALVDAVARADPEGDEMAAVVVADRTTDDPASGRPAGGPARRGSADDPATRLVAVDSTRLVAAAGWRPEWAGPSLADLASRLRPPSAEPLVLAGSRVDVELDAAFVRGGAGAAFTLDVVRPDGSSETVVLGDVRDGELSLSAELPACEQGCRLTRLDVRRRGDQADALVGDLVWTRLLVDGRELAGAFTPDDWRPTLVNPESPLGYQSSRLEPALAGLRMRYATQPSEDAGMARADAPEAVPVLAAGATQPRDFGRDGLVVATGPDREPLLARIAARTTVLPLLGDAGLLADLTVVQRRAPALEEDGTTFEVWSSRADVEGGEAALRAAGLRVLDVRAAAERRAGLDEGGPALVLSLLPVVALAAFAVAALALVAGALSEARGRAVESAALATVGLPARVLRGAALRESALLVVVGVCGGALAGALTAGLTGPDVGAIGLVGAVAPFPDRLPLSGLALATAFPALALAAVCAVTARVGVRGADPGLLRQVTT